MSIYGDGKYLKDLFTFRNACRPMCLSLMRGILTAVLSVYYGVLAAQTDGKSARQFGRSEIVEDDG